MKVLVIYDILPEDTLVSVVEMSESEYIFFKKAHTVIVNVTDWNDEGIFPSNVISNAFSTDPEDIEFCESDKEIEYFMKHHNGDNNQGSLNCSKNGQYLFSTLQHTFSSSEVKKDWEYSQNANGFLLKFNIRESMANELLKNKTLLKLNESE